MRATEPLAFASLITAVLAIMLVCCCGFLSVPLAGLAILLGVISLVRIQLDPLTYEGKGLAIAGIALGLLDLVLFGVLMALGLAANLMQVAAQS
jgi:hypothetical protein